MTTAHVPLSSHPPRIHTHTHSDKQPAMSSSSTAVAAMDVDAPSRPQTPPEAVFPIARNLRLGDERTISLYLDAVAADAHEEEEEDDEDDEEEEHQGPWTFLVQVHQGGNEEPLHVWTATIPTAADPGKRVKLKDLARALRNPAKCAKLEVQLLPGEGGKATLSIKETVAKGKKHLLTQELTPPTHPAHALAAALSKTAQQLAEAYAAQGQAEETIALLEQTNKEFKTLIDTRIGEKDRSFFPSTHPSTRLLITLPTYR